MIQFVDVILKEIFDQGRNFPWERPSKCPECNRWKVWGHGFVLALFDGFATPLWLKRYRCPDCRCIIQLRPASHFSRFQAPQKTIRSALEKRINHGEWPQGLSPSRMRYWLRNLRLQVRVHLTESWKAGLMAGFDRLIELGRIPVSSAI